jgi:hypothetical protein
MIGLRGISVQPDRMRSLRTELVDELAESIKERGQLQPIIVRPRKLGYFLVAGRHRLEAVKKLEHEAIECRVLEGLDADQALLAEIDENLIRADLSPAETATHHAERKRIYEKMHPETKRGSGGGRAKAAKTKKGAKSQNETEQQPSYLKDAVKKTGQSRAAVARDISRGEKIDSIALADLAGTCLDNGTELDALAKLPVKKQRDLAARAKAGEMVSAKSTAKPKKTAAAPNEEMPSEEEAEESWQNDLHDQACLLLERMSDKTRQRFFKSVKKLGLTQLADMEPVEPALNNDPEPEAETAKPKRMTRKQVREMKQSMDEAGKQMQLALRAAWMREQGKKAKEWERLRKKGQQDYHQERISRRNKAMDAAWLAERGEPCSHLYCGFTEEENKYHDELYKRFDWCDPMFDVPPAATDPVEQQEAAE